MNKIIKNATCEIKEILKQRGKEYGKFRNVATFCYEFVKKNKKSIKHLKGKEYKKAYVILFMLGLKLSRLENGDSKYRYDSVLDFIGYLELLKREKISIKLRKSKKAKKSVKKLIKHANIRL